MTDAERLREYVKEAYSQFYQYLPTTHGHCHRVSALAFVIAKATRLRVEHCVGFRQLPGNVKDVHSWILIDDSIVLHSLERGLVELTGLEGFERISRGVSA